jgi:hypothetical protein
VIADTGTAIPGGSGDFTSFSDPALSAGQVAFLGEGTGGQSGIYRDGIGALVVVADESTAIPGGSGDFTEFNGFALDGGSVALDGFGAGSHGLYLERGGGLEIAVEVGELIDTRLVIDLDFGIGLRELSDDQLAFLASFDDESRGVFIAELPVSPSMPM